MSDLKPKNEVVAAFEENDPLKSESKFLNPTKTRYGVLGFTLALTAVAYLDRVRISITAPAIQKDLHLNDQEMSWVFSAFMLSYALFEIPSGWMADRFGPRLTLTRIVIWWSIMSALTGWAWSLWSLFFIRLLFGMGEAGLFPSISRVYVRWLPIQEHGRSFGLALLMAALGTAISQPLMAHLLEYMSWRTIFPLFSIGGFVWAVFWFWWFRDEPQNHPTVNKAELALIGTSIPKAHRAVPWNSLLRSLNMYALCLLCASWLYGWYFWLTWLPTYLLRVHGYNIKEVGWLAALPPLASGFGMLVSGWSSDILIRRLGLRKGRALPGVICLPLAVMAMIVGVTATVPLKAVLLLSLAAGLAAAGITNIFPVCLEIGGRHAGVVSGTMNMVGNLGGALTPIVVGECLKRWNSWEYYFLTLVGAYLLATLCWLVVDPKKPIWEAH